MDFLKKLVGYFRGKKENITSNFYFLSIPIIAYISYKYFLNKYITDYIDYSLIIIALLSLLISKIHNKIALFTKNNFRYFFGLTLLSVIILRMFFFQGIYDNNSLITVMVVLLIIIVPDIGNIIVNLKKIKIGGFELELQEKLKTLETKAESEIEEKGSVSKNFDYYKKISNDILNSTASPKIKVITIATEIESAINKILENLKLSTKSKAPLKSARNKMYFLMQKEIISSNLLEVFNEFYDIRNKVVHGFSETIKDESYFSMIDIGLKILKSLISVEGFSVDVETNDT